MDTFTLRNYFLIVVLVASLYQIIAVLGSRIFVKSDLSRSLVRFVLALRLAGFAIGLAALYRLNYLELVNERNGVLIGRFRDMITPLAGFLTFVPVRIVRKTSVNPRSVSHAIWNQFCFAIVVVLAFVVVVKESIVCALVFKAADSITIASNTTAEPVLGKAAASAEFSQALEEYSWHELLALLPSATLSLAIGIVVLWGLLQKLFLNSVASPLRTHKSIWGSRFTVILFGSAILARYQANTLWVRLCPYISEVWKQDFTSNLNWLPIVFGFLACGWLVSWSRCYVPTIDAQYESIDQTVVRQPRIFLIASGLILVTFFVPWIVYLFVKLLCLIPSISVESLHANQWPLMGSLWNSMPTQAGILLVYLSVLVLIFSQIFRIRDETDREFVVLKPSLRRLISNWFAVTLCLPLFCVLSISFPVLIMMML